MNETPRGFPRHEDELAAFLEEDIRGSKERGLARARGDPSQGAHRAGDHNHGIEPRGTADKGDVHRAIPVLLHLQRYVHFAQFLGDHLFRVRAEDEMHFIGREIDLAEEPLKIDRAACAGAGNDKFQGLENFRQIDWYRVCPFSSVNVCSETCSKSFSVISFNRAP